LNKKSKAKSPANESAENKSTAGPSSTRPRSKQLAASAPGKLVLLKKASEPRTFGTVPGDDMVEGAIGAIIKGGEERAALLAQLHNAVESGDRKLVFKIAERYCGLSV
jgi:hypothetical protein